MSTENAEIIPTVEQWIERMDAEDERQTAHGFYLACEEREGVAHLLNWAIDYARQGKVIAAVTMIRRALRMLAKPEPTVSEEADALLGSDWLAAHDREVAAKALEDAGADWHALVMREKPPVTGATWLNRRAAAIRGAAHYRPTPSEPRREDYTDDESFDRADAD